MSVSDISGRIESTLLNPLAGPEEFERLLEEASSYGFHCVVVPPIMVKELYRRAESLGVRICAVIGFPSGFSPMASKVYEVEKVISWGAQEIDVVPSLTHIRMGDIAYVENEVRELVNRAKKYGLVFKLITEAPLLKEDELRKLVDICKIYGCDFVKTSTGVYSKGGDYSTVARLSGMAKPLGLKVKAAGGIRHAGDALLAIAAGADRIGTSSAGEVMRTFIAVKGGKE